MANYKNLIVWQKAMDLVIEIYRLTKKFPASELYGLTSQMRRAAVSVPSNIAEGTKRNGGKDTRQFYVIAIGSGSELETQLDIAKRLKFTDAFEYERIDSLLEEVMKMLSVLIRNNKLL